MSRRRKPARLWLRPANNDREAVWIILDGGRQHSTGCRAHDHAGAEAALGKHIAKQFLAAGVPKNRAASEVAVAEVLAHYLEAKAGSVRRGKEFAARVDSLLDWWGERTLDDITSRTCRDYATSRTTLNQARRELEDLRAAINMAIADNVTRHAVKVTLPSKPKGRVEHLDRDTLARLIWTAYRKREVQRGRTTKKRPMAHLARFLIVGLYTGSRSARVWQASYYREEGRPFADLDRGVFYRAPTDEIVASNKQAPPIRIPPRLLAHMRRWEANGSRYVVEYQGRPADPKRAFRKLVEEVLGEKGRRVVRHTLRHTLATWLMQAGTDMWEASGYLGMTRETLQNTYGHHHPSHQSGVATALTRGTAGRLAK